MSFCRPNLLSTSRLSESAPRNDAFIATKTIVSQDPEVLNFEINDEIIVFGETDNGMLMGRRAAFPGKSGIVDPKNLRPVSYNQRDSLTSVGPTVMCESNGQSGAGSTTYYPNISPVLSSKKLIKLISSTSNQDIRMFPWFFGTRNRIQANELLAGTADGTFIVRLSQKENKYVISLAYGGYCKHMKIECIETPEGSKVYYLHDARFFNSVPVSFF